MALRPMLATLADAPLAQRDLVYEPKYDGIRAIIEIAPGKGTGGRGASTAARVRIWSRNGNEKTHQFPMIRRTLEAVGAKLKGALVLDGEIVALDERGRPAGFQRLQGRIHLTSASDVERVERGQPVAFIAFDILSEGGADLCRLPLTERRRRLDDLFKKHKLDADETVLRISEQVAGDARALYARAQKEGWEGLIAKDAASTYQPGRRSPAWRKIKLVKEQEFVIGGWTEPRQTRAHFGALLLGVYDGSALTYAGHTGTGFDHKELERVWKLLKARETKQSPFSTRIKTNEPAHWVRPDLVAQIKFTEWTDDDKLRHPVYLGLRDDKEAREVGREGAREAAKGAKGPERPKSPKGPKGAKGPEGPKGADGAGGANGARGANSARGAKGARGANTARVKGVSAVLQGVLDQLTTLEKARRDGELALPNGDRLKVTNLSKPYWPELKLTKGDLLRYYVEVSPFLLPVVEDRPLVMKRFPNGVGGKAFYQQRSREERPPAGVRVETLDPDLEPIGEPDARRLVGGSLTTLLYMTQIAAISQDPWFCRVQSALDADYVAIDLDPTDEAPFARVLDVARWVRDELATLGVPGFPKTSGSSGMHVYIPLPPGTSYESGMLFCQIVATVVAARHPKVATVERTVKRRPRGTVYVDFLQNILGKTLATAYSARASAFAGVSTPLTWKEVDTAIDPRAFTIRTAPARFRETGDLWAGLRTTKPADLEAVFEKYARLQTRP